MIATAFISVFTFGATLTLDMEYMTGARCSQNCSSSLGADALFFKGGGGQLRSTRNKGGSSGGPNVKQPTYSGAKGGPGPRTPWIRTYTFKEVHDCLSGYKDLCIWNYLRSARVATYHTAVKERPRLSTSSQSAA